MAPQEGGFCWCLWKGWFGMLSPGMAGEAASLLMLCSPGHQGVVLVALGESQGAGDKPWGTAGDPVWDDAGVFLQVSPFPDIQYFAGLNPT